MTTHEKSHNLNPVSCKDFAKRKRGAERITIEVRTFIERDGEYPVSSYYKLWNYFLAIKQIKSCLRLQTNKSPKQ